MRRFCGEVRSHIKNQLLVLRHHNSRSADCMPTQNLAVNLSLYLYSKGRAAQNTKKNDYNKYKATKMCRCAWHQDRAARNHMCTLVAAPLTVWNRCTKLKLDKEYFSTHREHG